MRTETPPAPLGTGSVAALSQQGENLARTAGFSPDPKPAARIVDSKATTRKLLVDRECRACGSPAATGHHLIPKGERGDDVVENVVPVCGSGTSGCHGALHGNPYEVESGYTVVWDAREPAGGPMRPAMERRDAEWVRRRIGANLRPEEIAYVAGKLGERGGYVYLVRHYYFGVAP